MYGNCMHIDIIVHDALAICMSRIFHVALIVHVTCNGIIELHMHKRIAWHGLSA